MARTVKFTTNDMISKFLEYDLSQELYETFYLMTVHGLIPEVALTTFEKNTMNWVYDDDSGEVVDETTGYVVDSNSISDYLD